MLVFSCRNPIEFIVFWYIGWSFVALIVSLYLWSGPIPSTIATYLTLTISLLIVYVVFSSAFRGRFIFERSLPLTISASLLERLCRRFLLCYAALVFILGIWMLQIFLNNPGDLLRVRMGVFDMPLFGNIYFAAAHSILVSYISCVAALCVSLHLVLFKARRYLAIAAFITLLHCLVTLGRYPLMMLVLAVFLMKFIFSKNLAFSSIFKYAVLVSCFFFAIEHIRNSGSADFAFSLLVDGFWGIIAYGVVPFFLVEALLNDKESFLYLPHSFGLSMLGPVDTLGVFLQRELGYMASPVSGKNGGFLREFIIVAEDGVGAPVYANAAGSFFTTLFRDGGYFLLFLSPIFLGFYLRYLQHCAARSSAHAIHFIFVVFLSVLSLFQSQIESLSIVVILLSPLILKLFGSRRPYRISVYKGPLESLHTAGQNAK